MARRLVFAQMDARPAEFGTHVPEPWQPAALSVLPSKAPVMMAWQAQGRKNTVEYRYAIDQNGGIAGAAAMCLSVPATSSRAQIPRDVGSISSFLAECRFANMARLHQTYSKMQVGRERQAPDIDISSLCVRSNMPQIIHTTIAATRTAQHLSAIPLNKARTAACTPYPVCAPTEDIAVGQVIVTNFVQQNTPCEPAPWDWLPICRLVKTGVLWSDTFTPLVNVDESGDDRRSGRYNAKPPVEAYSAKHARNMPSYTPCVTSNLADKQDVKLSGWEYVQRREMWHPQDLAMYNLMSLCEKPITVKGRLQQVQKSILDCLRDNLSEHTALICCDMDAESVAFLKSLNNQLQHALLDSTWGGFSESQRALMQQLQWWNFIPQVHQISYDMEQDAGALFQQSQWYRIAQKVSKPYEPETWHSIVANVWDRIRERALRYPCDSRATNEVHTEQMQQLVPLLLVDQEHFVQLEARLTCLDPVRVHDKSDKATDVSNHIELLLPVTNKERITTFFDSTPTNTTMQRARFVTQTMQRETMTWTDQVIVSRMGQASNQILVQQPPIDKSVCMDKPMLASPSVIYTIFADALACRSLGIPAQDEVFEARVIRLMALELDNIARRQDLQLPPQKHHMRTQDHARNYHMYTKLLQLLPPCPTPIPGELPGVVTADEYRAVVLTTAGKASYLFFPRLTDMPLLDNDTITARVNELNSFTSLYKSIASKWPNLRAVLQVVGETPAPVATLADDEQVADTDYASSSSSESEDNADVHVRMPHRWAQRDKPSQRPSVIDSTAGILDVIGLSALFASNQNNDNASDDEDALVHDDDDDDDNDARLPAVGSDGKYVWILTTSMFSRIDNRDRPLQRLRVASDSEKQRHRGVDTGRVL